MMLTRLLQHKKKDILESWCDQIYKTYPADAAQFMKRDSNRFSNPVGQTIRRECTVILDSLLSGNADDASTAIDSIVKIRAVQEFSASRAVAFIYFLKTIIRSVAAGDEQVKSHIDQLLTMESHIDNLALRVFDAYTANREKLNEIRLNEAKRRVSLLMERARANIIVEKPE